MGHWFEPNRAFSSLCEAVILEAHCVIGIYANLIQLYPIRNRMQKSTIVLPIGITRIADEGQPIGDNQFAYRTEVKSGGGVSRIIFPGIRSPSNPTSA